MFKKGSILEKLAVLAERSEKRSIRLYKAVISMKNQLLLFSICYIRKRKLLTEKFMKISTMFIKQSLITKKELLLRIFLSLF